jgi:hypothetical protein
MVGHQNPGECVGNTGNIFVVQIQKIPIVIVFQEQIASIGATVINVKKLSVRKGWLWIWHFFGLLIVK